MKIEKVVEFRTHPTSIVTIDGEQYIPFKEFCAMTGLKPSFVVQNEEMQGQIVELPPTGKQRKPRKYVSVKAWLALWERVFNLLFVQRMTDAEATDLEEAKGVRGQWTWFGIDKIAKMFEIDETDLDIVTQLMNRGFVPDSAHEISSAVAEGLRLTNEGLYATDAAKATGWIRNYMPAPSPYGRWHIHIMLDVAHPEFVKFLANIKGWPLEVAQNEVDIELQYEVEEREARWHQKSKDAFSDVWTRRLLDRYERHNRLAAIA